MRTRRREAALGPYSKGVPRLPNPKSRRNPSATIAQVEPIGLRRSHMVPLGVTSVGSLGHEGAPLRSTWLPSSFRCCIGYPTCRHPRSRAPSDVRRWLRLCTAALVAFGFGSRDPRDNREPKPSPRIASSAAEARSATSSSTTHRSAQLTSPSSLTRKEFDSSIAVAPTAHGFEMRSSPKFGFRKVPHSQLGTTTSTC